MAPVFFQFSCIIRDDERGLLMRDGRFERLLPPGRFRELDIERKLSVEIVKVVGAEFPFDRARLLISLKPEMAEAFTLIQTGANEVAVVDFDGQFKSLVRPNSNVAYWSLITSVTVERVNTASNLHIERRILDRIGFDTTPTRVSELIEPHETGLLIVDGQIVERLPPGRHAFWNVARTVRVARVDLRPTPLEVTAQEILTKDRINIRVTLTAFYRIVDPEKAVTAAADLASTLYRLVQFAIREAVATRSLDDILAARDSIDTEVRAYVAERALAMGAEVGEIGVKDVILPGEVRDLLNKVVEAERVARANLIRRQEETAATRSLLNTARLMEDNPLLLRLKELEALERLVEKVGHIDLHSGETGGGFQSLLTGLYRLRGPDPEV